MLFPNLRRRHCSTAKEMCADVDEIAKWRRKDKAKAAIPAVEKRN